MDYAVAEYLQDKKDQLPCLFDWKFDEGLAAEKFNIEFEGLNRFEKNQELKYHLRARVTNDDPAHHGGIATYFIRDWGGIRRFSKVSETQALFSELAGTPTVPITFTPPFKSISSWSKWASIACH